MRIEVDEHTYRMLIYFTQEQEFPLESFSDVIKHLIYLAEWDKGTPFEGMVFL